MSRSDAQKDLSDLAVVAGTPEGRRLLGRLIDHSGMFVSPLVPDLPKSSHYNMGVAALGQALWSELLIAAPEALSWYIGERAKQLHIPPEEAEEDDD